MNRPKRSLLVLYAANSVQTPTVRDYLDAFRLNSKFEVKFANAVSGARIDVPLESFDSIFVHYSVRLCYPGYLSSDFASGLEHFRGPKILSIQDEYENTEEARKLIEALQFDVVLTCVRPEDIPKIYPSARFPNTKFTNVLTGYIPESIERVVARPLIASRGIDIVYRGKSLPYIWGRLGQEKARIGKDVRELAQRSGFSCDIEVDEKSRIYGSAWFDFLRSGRATLASESGSNVFDFDGTLHSQIAHYMAEHPTASFDEVEQLFLKGREGRDAMMNQISPRVFEAIICGTALIMFEGSYSGVLEPHRHYLSLKKDYSNWPEIAGIIRQPEKLQALADEAYRSVVGSGLWSYATFVSKVDDLFATLLSAKGAQAMTDSSDVVTERVDIAKMPGGPPNCFSHPIDLVTIENLQRNNGGTRTPSEDHATGIALKRGEVARLWWRKLVPEWCRRIVSRRLKNYGRRVLGLPSER